VSVVANKFLFGTEIGLKNFDNSSPNLAQNPHPNLQLWSPLHLQHSRFVLQRSHSMYATVLPWEESTNHMPRK